jgi:hypothetical protein
VDGAVAGAAGATLACGAEAGAWDAANPGALAAEAGEDAASVAAAECTAVAGGEHPLT